MNQQQRGHQPLLCSCLSGKLDLGSVSGGKHSSFIGLSLNLLEATHVPKYDNEHILLCKFNIYFLTQKFLSFFSHILILNRQGRELASYSGLSEVIPYFSIPGALLSTKPPCASSAQNTLILQLNAQMCPTKEAHSRFLIWETLHAVREVIQTSENG